VRTLVDLRSRVGIEDSRETVDQRGLLSIAFAPDYARSGRLYIDYVDRARRLRVAEWRRGGGRTLRTVLDLGEATTMHHGGQLQFGPGGLLYVSTGMGRDPDSSQDPRSPAGKILRFDPRRSPVEPEVVATGLRNPWRFSLHRGTLVIGDVGEERVEEVNVLPSGSELPVNFGWPFREGRDVRREGAPAGLRPPALTHRHGAGWCSLVGGYVHRGRYVYGDVCSGRLWTARFSAGRLSGARRLGLTVAYLVSFGRDRRGRLYAVSLNGSVWRIRTAR
jgi:glucose/arabinose dehydrogenase